MLCQLFVLNLMLDWEPMQTEKNGVDCFMQHHIELFHTGHVTTSNITKSKQLNVLKQEIGPAYPALFHIMPLYILYFIPKKYSTQAKTAI